MDVVVVGAGLAGLSAACELRDAGVSVVVVEARDRVGGRVQGDALEGHPIELGGTWIGEGHTEMHALVGALGLKTFPTWNSGRSVVQFGTRQHRVNGTEAATLRLDPVVLADIAQGLTRFGELAQAVDPAEPWTHAKAELIDGQTLETWLQRNLRTSTGRDYLRVATEAVFAADATEISLLHALFYAVSNADMETLLAVDRGAQQDRVVGGSVLLAQHLAEGLDVRLSTPIAGITQDETHATVRTRSGEVLPCDRVVVTLPPTLAGRLDYDPPLPAWRDQLTQRLPAGTVVKTFAAYPTPFWRDQGLNGQAASDAGPVKITFDVSPPGGEIGVLLGFVEGGEARRWQQLPDLERRRSVIKSLVRYFGPDAAEPTAYMEKDWSAEEFTRGCYGAHFAPGVWTGYGHALRPAVGRIHWAGTEYAVQWNGYMEGAVRSGQVTARELIDLIFRVLTRMAQHPRGAMFIGVSAFTAWARVTADRLPATAHASRWWGRRDHVEIAASAGPIRLPPLTAMPRSTPAPSGEQGRRPQGGRSRSRQVAQVLASSAPD